MAAKERISDARQLQRDPYKCNLSTVQRYFPQLKQYLDLNLVVPYLVSDKLLTPDDTQILTNSHKSEGDRISTLITSILPKKGPDGSQRFLDCIRRVIKDNGDAVGGLMHIEELLSQGSSFNEEIQAEGRHSKQLKIKFSGIVKETWKRLEGVYTDIENELIVFICAFPLKKSTKIAIQRATNMREVFDILNNDCWSYTDTEVLEGIIENFCDQDMIDKMKEYNGKFELLDQ